MRVYLVQIAALVAVWLVVTASFDAGKRPWAAPAALVVVYVLTAGVITYAGREDADDVTTQAPDA